MIDVSQKKVYSIIGFYAPILSQGFRQKMLMHLRDNCEIVGFMLGNPIKILVISIRRKLKASAPTR